MILPISDNIIYTITLGFFLLNLYLIFKIKGEYKKYQKRSLCTSALCFTHHELYVAFACYCAWYNIWPIFKLSTNLFHHLALFTFGLIPSFIGLIIYFLYLGKMGSFPRAIGRNADELITDGIFSITRNPQSLGRGIGLIGIGIMGRSNFTLFLALSWILFNHFHIRIEEKHLEDKFGESYLQYCASTPRYYKIIRKN